MILEHLGWDSAHFKIRIGKIDLYGVERSQLNDTIVQMNRKGFDLIYLFAPVYLQDLTDDLLGYENRKDTKVVYSKLLLEDISMPPDILIPDQLSLAERDRVIRLGLASGIFSRFKLDDRLTPGRFEEMYKIWTEKAIDSQDGNHLALYKEGESILGVITYKVKLHVVEVGLLSVDPACGGKGIGSKLLRWVEYFALQNGLSTINIPTQATNLPACKFYDKNGYIITDLVNVYHIWNI
ncbi:MAG TPA: GNAT family N-acetyltransferase [Saprospiraceae bacterium]|nr:GNAT family N-acetyltransferase [Saprospiraceae bacterium]